MLTVVAFQMLKDAGYEVTPADRAPGLFNVEGLAQDVTTGQLHDLAQRHGFHRALPAYPTIRIGGVT